jgi:putative DNA primase/helicase
MWRRVRLIPFTVTIPDNEQDRGLTGKLLAELPGILTWAVKGCLDWQHNGLQPPAAVMAATQDYREEMDTLGAFIADACNTSPNATEVASDLYRAYCAWCEMNGERYPLTQTAFGRRLTERGFPTDRVGSHRLRRGIALRRAEDR